MKNVITTLICTLILVVVGSIHNRYVSDQIEFYAEDCYFMQSQIKEEIHQLRKALKESKEEVLFQNLMAREQIKLFIRWYQPDANYDELMQQFISAIWPDDEVKQKTLFETYKLILDQPQ